MAKRTAPSVISPPDYYGKILHGMYSDALKTRVSECREHFLALERLGHPVISYVSAWKAGGNSMWYEFVSQHLLRLLDCSYTDVANVFRRSVVDLRLYTNECLEIGILKRVIASDELRSLRTTLRDEAQKSGAIEAIYKVVSSQNRTVWLKDQATVEPYPQDKLCLSIGYLTVVSKEMEAEEEQEKLVVRLREDLGRIRKRMIQGQFL